MFTFSFVILLIFFFSSYAQTKKETISLIIPYEMHFVIPELVNLYTKDHKKSHIEIHEVSSSEFPSLPKQGIQILDSWSGNLKKPFLKSPLVVIGHRKIYSLDELQNASISIPDPDYNTTGVNVIKILRHEKLWDLLKRSISYKQKGILCMETVDLQEEDYAIVSLADCYFLKNAFPVLSLAERKSFAIQYAIKNYDKEKETQKQFYEFLCSPKAMKIFEKYGFLSPLKEDSTKSVQ